MLSVPPRPDALAQRAPSRALPEAGHLQAEPAPIEPAQSDPGRSPSPARKAQVARELMRLLPQGSVLWREEDLRPYECDALTAFRQMPMLVVMPRHTVSRSARPSSSRASVRVAPCAITFATMGS